MIYLASPYSHPSPVVRLSRYRDAFQATVALMLAGRVVYSPIVYSHPLFAAGVGATGAFAEWEALDRAIIGAASMLWVLTLDGWEASKGIKAELEIAAERNVPVQYLSLDEALSGGPR